MSIAQLLLPQPVREALLRGVDPMDLPTIETHLVPDSQFAQRRKRLDTSKNPF